MTHPHVVFEYDKEKDLENLKIGLAVARNGRSADGEISRIVRELETNDPTDVQLNTYIENWWVHKEHFKPLIIEPLQLYWNSIEQTFFEKLYSGMQLYSWYGIETINAFLSIRYGCGYNAKERWFAVSTHASTFKNTATAMHELMHLFFYERWGNFCREQGLSDDLVWDIKEAFTTLLNTWFADILIDTDFGYSEHQNLRKHIRDWYEEKNDFETMCKKACVYMKEHPHEHASWKV